jgi:hypothetical protein
LLSTDEITVHDKYSGFFLNVSYSPANCIKNIEGISINDNYGTTLAFKTLDEVTSTTLYAFCTVFNERLGSMPSYIELEDNKQIVRVKDDKISMYVLFNESVEKDNAKSTSNFLLSEFNRFYNERSSSAEGVNKYEQFFGLVGLLI